MFTDLCLDNSKHSYHISPPIGTLNLPLGCRAFSASILIPSQFIHTSHVYVKSLTQLPSPNISLYDFKNSKFTQSGAVHYKLPNQIPLAKTDDDSIHSLLNNLHDHVQKVYHIKDTIPIKHSIWKSTLGSLLGVLLVLLVIVVCVKCKLYKACFNCPMVPCCKKDGPSRQDVPIVVQPTTPLTQLDTALTPPMTVLPVPKEASTASTMLSGPDTPETAPLYAQIAKAPQASLSAY